MEAKPKVLPYVVAILTTLLAVGLVLYRGGVIVWLALILGALLLIKIWRKPGPRDFILGCLLASLSFAAWMVTYFYVIFTWESGEVIQLAVQTEQGPHVARLWVMDIDDTPVVYYDAVPHAAQALIAGAPVLFTRNGETLVKQPQATPVDTVPEASAVEILAAMENKYGDRNLAATVYYLMLGRPHDRVPLLVVLNPAQGSSQSADPGL